MKKALIITYYWPPSGGSGVQRWVKFAKYLPSFGWQPVIYTPENPELSATDPSLAVEIPPEAVIIKRKILEPYGIYNRLSGKKTKSSGLNPINSQDKSLRHRIFLWIRANFFVPDPRIGWLRPSLRFLKKYLRDNPVDVIVSTGPPQSMHLIARKLALETGIPWIADFRDPWTKMFYYKDLPLTRRNDKRQHEMEKKVLKDASVVVAVSPLVQEEFMAMTDTPVALITNGYDESDFEGEVAQGEYFTITHTGLFSSVGNPETLWSVLGKMCAADADFAASLRIRLAGKTDREIKEAIESAGLGKKMENLGYVPHADAVREQRRASLLILPLRKEPEYRAVLPGKLFEYLASGRPILGIGQTDGAMARLIEENNAGQVAEWEDEKTIKEYIEYCWECFRTGKEAREVADVGKYSRRALSATMAALMDSLLK